MMRLSIKMKLTLWYTGLVVIIMAFVLSFVWFSSDKALIFQVQHQMKELAEESIEDMDFENGTVRLDEHFDFYDDGINVLLYNEDGRLLNGTNPSGFEETNTPFKHDEMQTAESSGTEWMVYDTRVAAGNEDHIWIRCVMTLNQYTRTMNAVLIAMVISFPLLILLAAFGGYWITKRAFRPVQQIIVSVNDIRDEKDLSKRIRLKGPQDEIHALADTFDSMFDRLEASFENERQFTADASHELRTPTSVILSQSEYALSHTDDPEEMKESLEVILKQSRKMSGLISQLLLLARTEEKQNGWHFETFDMSELAEMVTDELRELAENEHIALQTDVKPGLSIEADQTLMMRLLMNLITNAIAYNKKDGTVTVKLYEEDRSIVGKITDTGIGIQEKHLDKIWERFYRVDPARTSTASGNTGLGLSLVKWIVNVHDGELAVESVYGKGSTFTFRIPQKRRAS